MISNDTASLLIAAARRPLEVVDDYGPRDYSAGFDWNEIYQADPSEDLMPRIADRRRNGARYRWATLAAPPR